MEQQGGSYNPITVVVMKARRPRLEVQHFWHPLTRLHCKSQQLRGQKTLCADYHALHRLKVTDDMVRLACKQTILGIVQKIQMSL